MSKLLLTENVKDFQISDFWDKYFNLSSFAS